MIQKCRSLLNGQLLSIIKFYVPIYIFFIYFFFLLFVVALCTKCILVQFGFLFKDKEVQINSESSN